MGLLMDTIGLITYKGRKMLVQEAEGGFLYVDGYPVDQYPREVRDRARDAVEMRLQELSHGEQSP
jgi:hypothetical protein